MCMLLNSLTDNNVLTYYFIYVWYACMHSQVAYTIGNHVRSIVRNLEVSESAHTYIQINRCTQLLWFSDQLWKICSILWQWLVTGIDCFFPPRTRAATKHIQAFVFNIVHSIVPNKTYYGSWKAFEKYNIYWLYIVCIFDDRINIECRITLCGIPGSNYDAPAWFAVSPAESHSTKAIRFVPTCTEVCLYFLRDGLMLCLAFAATCRFAQVNWNQLINDMWACERTFRCVYGRVPDCVCVCLWSHSIASVDDHKVADEIGPYSRMWLALT